MKESIVTAYIEFKKEGRKKMCVVCNKIIKDINEHLNCQKELKNI